MRRKWKYKGVRYSIFYDSDGKLYINGYKCDDSKAFYELFHKINDSDPNVSEAAKEKIKDMLQELKVLNNHKTSYSKRPAKKQNIEEYHPSINFGMFEKIVLGILIVPIVILFYYWIIKTICEIPPFNYIADAISIGFEGFSSISIMELILAIIILLFALFIRHLFK